MSKDKVEAVERALAVLNAFHSDKPTMTLGEIASATGFYKSTILRLAGSLERLGYLIREERGGVRLRPALWPIGSVYPAGVKIRDGAPARQRPPVGSSSGHGPCLDPPGQTRGA